MNNEHIKQKIIYNLHKELKNKSKDNIELN